MLGIASICIGHCILCDQNLSEAESHFDESAFKYANRMKFQGYEQKYNLLSPNRTIGSKHHQQAVQILCQLSQDREVSFPSAFLQLYLDRHAGVGQQEVCRCLMHLGVSYTLENVVDQILAVDIVLKMPEHPKVAIKVISLLPRNLFSADLVVMIFLTISRHIVACSKACQVYAGKKC